MSKTLYVGRVLGFPGDRDYAFIDAQSVRRVDGQPPDVVLSDNVFLHRDDMLDGPLAFRAGIEVRFELEPDKKRGEGHFRAHRVVETKESARERFVHGGVTLNIQGSGGTGSRVLEHSSVFVSWCLSQELVEQVKAYRAEGKSVMLLLICGQQRERRRSIDYHEWNETRYLIDLDEPMAIISFDRPGTHRIFGLVVESLSADRLKDVLLDRNKRGYDWTVLASDGYGVTPSSTKFLLGSGCVDVMMPHGLFAKRPFDWEWVNWLFKSPPRDECSLRWRRLFAYTVQPLIWLVILLVAIIVIAVCWIRNLVLIALFLSVGVWQLGYRTLAHPHDATWDEILRPGSQSLFIPKIRGRWILFPLTISPPVLLLAALATWFTSDAPLFGIAWFATFCLVMLVPIAFFAVLSITVWFLQGVDWEQRTREADERERQRMFAQLDQLTCTSDGPREPSVHNLQLGVRTVRFFAHALKQRVCRGFSS